MLSEICPEILCGGAQTESEKLDCLVQNKHKIFYCCNNCTFYKDNKKFDPKLEDIEYEAKPYIKGDVSCWFKHCGTEEDKTRCLEKNRASVCNCCKDMGLTDCTFQVNDSGKTYNPCLNLYGFPKKTETPIKNIGKSISVTTPNSGKINYLNYIPYIFGSICIILIIILFIKIYRNRKKKIHTRKNF